MARKKIIDAIVEPVKQAIEEKAIEFVHEQLDITIHRNGDNITLLDPDDKTVAFINIKDGDISFPGGIWPLMEMYFKSKEHMIEWLQERIK